MVTGREEERVVGDEGSLTSVAIFINITNVEYCILVADHLFTYEDSLFVLPCVLTLMTLAVDRSKAPTNNNNNT